MSQGGSNKKVANSLVALSSAAVLAVYSAGYIRTRPAADRLAAQAAERRPALPPPPAAVVPSEIPAAPAAVPEPPAAAVASPVPKKEVAAATPVSAPAESAAPITGGPSAAPAPPLLEAPSQPVATLIAAATPVAAPAPPEPKVEAPAPAPAPAHPVWKDGTYTGWGNSRHGSIQSSVVIENGRIVSATIAQCLTRYSCSVIDKLPPEVAERQSPEVDFVSGATQSANAFYYGVVEALTKAK